MLGHKWPTPKGATIVIVWSKRQSRQKANAVLPPKNTCPPNDHFLVILRSFSFCFLYSFSFKDLVSPILRIQWDIFWPLCNPEVIPVYAIDPWKKHWGTLVHICFKTALDFVYHRSSSRWNLEWVRDWRPSSSRGTCDERGIRCYTWGNGGMASNPCQVIAIFASNC